MGSFSVSLTDRDRWHPTVVFGATDLNCGRIFIFIKLNLRNHLLLVQMDDWKKSTISSQLLVIVTGGLHRFFCCAFVNLALHFCRSPLHEIEDEAQTFVDQWDLQ